LKHDPSLRLFGQRIRAARKAKGLSQEELAFEAEIDRSYMGGVERGHRNPSLLKMCRIAKVLGRDVGFLTKGLPVVQVMEKK
jgi:transcriptional regulator with XRE-family HTH domain